MIVRAMTSHYRRHPLQLAALALMIVVATMLWTGVSVLTGQARDSLAVSEASVAERESVVRVDGQPVSVADFVTLRRAGVCVAPWLETSRDESARRVIGIDPLAMGCFKSSPGTGKTGSLNGDPFIDISDVANGDGQLSLLIGSSTDALPPAYQRKTFRLGPATGELADSFLLNLDALSLLVLFITGLLVRSVYHLGLAQRRSSFALLSRFGVQAARVQRLLAAELLILTLVCVVPGVLLGQALASWLGQGFGRALNSLFDVSLYAGASSSVLWQAAIIMVALVLGACLVDRVLPSRHSKHGKRSEQSHRLISARHRRSLLLLLLALGLATVIWASSLVWVFAGAALVFVGVGGLVPGLLAWWADTMASRKPQSPGLPLGRWRYRELAVMFGNLALPVVALQFAAATVLAVQALVTTFEDTFEEWLSQRLAAEFYVEVPDSAKGDAGAQALAELDGLGDWHWVRRTSAELRSAETDGALTADVLALSPVSELLTGWTLLSSVERPWAALKSGAVMINEQLARRQGIELGQRLRFEIGGQAMAGDVAAIYADYGRPSAELLIHGQLLPQVLSPDFQSFSINAGNQSVEAITGQLQKTWQVGDLVVRDNASLKALASQIFQQTFLLTRAISVLTLVLASLSLLVMGWVFFGTRARYFQLLGVWGVSLVAVRGQLRRLALLLTFGVTVVGLPLGIWLTWVLVSRINPLAFGWSLPMAVYPAFWLELGVLMALIGLAIAGLIGRQLGGSTSGSSTVNRAAIGVEGGDR